LIYQRYLESVLEIVEDFGEVKDVIARHDTLVATNADLIERQQDAQRKTEATRAVLFSYTQVFITS
jgi:hypothetical protein